MSDPTWIATGGGSPEVNGDYFPDGYNNQRLAFINANHIYLTWTGYPMLCWALQSDFPIGPVLYTGTQGDGRYDLPALPWIATPGGIDPPPTLAAYGPPEPPSRPRATILLTAGQVDPANIHDATPTLSWTFLPADGGPPQSAYQIHVATSQALLDAHLPDLWDSGIIESTNQEMIYLGTTLTDYKIYFWGVRVRDEAGIWSEDWD